MIDLLSTQREVFDNKKRRGFNTTDIGKEIVLLTEELGELARSFKQQNNAGMKDAVGDIMVYCLGLCEMMNTDSEALIRDIVENNKTRTHAGHL